MQEQTLCLPALMEHYEEMMEHCMRSASEAGLAKEVLGGVRLVAEELLLNIIHHAYPPPSGDLTIRSFTTAAPGAQWCMELSDEGTPFNPLEAGPPSAEMDIENRPIGGLGIHLVRKKADSLDYRRDEGKNILTACFSLPS